MNATLNASTERVLKVVWSALLVSLVLYAFIVFRMFPRELPLRLDGLADFSDPMKASFIGTSLMSVAMSVFLPKFILNAVIKKRASSKPLELPEMATLFFVPMIIRLAMLESVTLYGFVLAMTHQDPVLILPFAAVSIAGFALNYPSEEKVRATFSAPI